MKKIKQFFESSNKSVKINYTSPPQKHEKLDEELNKLENISAKDALIRIITLFIMLPIVIAIILLVVSGIDLIFKLGLFIFLSVISISWLSFILIKKRKIIKQKYKNMDLGTKIKKVVNTIKIACYNKENKKLNLDNIIKIFIIIAFIILGANFIFVKINNFQKNRCIKNIIQANNSHSVEVLNFALKFCEAIHK